MGILRCTHRPLTNELEAQAHSRSPLTHEAPRAAATPGAEPWLRAPPRAAHGDRRRRRARRRPNSARPCSPASTRTCGGGATPRRDCCGKVELHLRARRGAARGHVDYPRTHDTARGSVAAWATVQGALPLLAPPRSVRASRCEQAADATSTRRPGKLTRHDHHQGSWGDRPAAWGRLVRPARAPRPLRARGAF